MRGDEGVDKALLHADDPLSLLLDDFLCFLILIGDFVEADRRTTSLCDACLPRPSRDFGTDACRRGEELGTKAWAREWPTPGENIGLITEGVSGKVCRFPDAGIVDKLPWEVVRFPTKLSRHIAHVQKKMMLTTLYSTFICQNNVIKKIMTWRTAGRFQRIREARTP